MIQHQGQKGWPGRLSLALLVAGLALVTFASSASALTYGVGWTGYGEANSEMELVNRSGASLFRIPIDRANCWGENWGFCDEYVKAAWEHGITIEPYLVWSRNGKTRYLLPEHFEEGNWGAWSREVVERYGINGDFWNGKANPKPITSWEVWNEPNFKVNNPLLASGEEKIQPQNYGRFLKFTAEKIQQGSITKTAHGTDVLFGGLYMPGGEYYNSFLEQASQVEGVGGSYTGVSIHPYSFYTPVQGMIDEINDVRYGLDHRVSGGAGKPLWVTELGWGVHGTEQPTFTEEQQAQYLTESFNWISASAATDNIRSVTWYNFRDNAGQTTWADYCGLRRRDGTYRPSWFAFQEEVGAPQVVPGPPTVQTSAATSLTSEGATLNGTVNPNGFQTSFHLDFGPTTEYGYTLALSGNAGSGSSNVAVNINPPAALLAGTTYHYRLVATNSEGTSYGNDISFTTSLGAIQSEDDEFAGPRSVELSSGFWADVLYRTAGSELGHDWLHEAPWGSEVIAGALSSETVVRPLERPNGWIDSYYRTASGGLGHTFYDTTTGWHSETLGGLPVSDPHAVEAPNAWSDVFYRNTSGGLGHDWQHEGPWGSEEITGGLSSTTSPVADSDSNGHINVFYRTASGGLGHSWYDTVSWHSEELPTNGTPVSDPRVVALPNGWIDVFYRLSGGELGHSWIHGGAWGSEKLPGTLSSTSTPRPIERPNGWIDVFYRNPSGTLGHTWYDTVTWHSENLPTQKTLAIDPQAVELTNGYTDLFYRTPGGELGHDWLHGGPWGSEILAGGLDSSGAPHPIERPNGWIDVYFRIASGGLGHTWFDTSSWHSEMLPGSVG